MIEQLLRIKRGGAELRPFCREAQVKHRGYSLRLQRVLTDFGSEVSFGRAVSRVREHYAVEVPVEAVRQHTLRHAKPSPHWPRGRRPSLPHKSSRRWTGA
jgi:hypothetical protein